MQSGSVEITPGKVFNEQDGETVDLEKLNRMVQEAVLRIAENAVTAREIKDGSITSDKLADQISAQLGVPNGSVTIGKLAAGFVLTLAKGGTGQTTLDACMDQFTHPANAVQVLLTGTNLVYNHSSETVDPAEGVRGADDAFWLVEDDNGTEAVVSITPRKVNSKVKFECVMHCDNNSSNVATAFKLQRSTDGGSSWDDLGLGDASSTRVRISFIAPRGLENRSLGVANYSYIDTPGVDTEVQYRLLYSCVGGNKIVLNRDWGIDDSGDAGGVTSPEYRCSSVLNVQELWIP